MFLQMVRWDDSGFLAPHGVSCLVKVYGDATILFDTGYNGDAVLHDMKLLELSVDSIDHIILSHDHYDHANGSVSSDWCFENSLQSLHYKYRNHIGVLESKDYSVKPVKEAETSVER